GEGDLMGLAVLGQQLDGLAFEPLERSRKLLAAALGLGEPDAGFISRPIAVVREASERPVDAGRADLKPVTTLDRVGEVENFRQAARNLFAIAEAELARVGTLGHYLQRRIGRAA